MVIYVCINIKIENHTFLALYENKSSISDCRRILPLYSNAFRKTIKDVAFS